MPFSEGDQPSLGLSLLKSALARRGISCDIHYLNLPFTSLIGLDRFNRLDRLSRPFLAGEWVFAESLWGPDEGRDRAYLAEIGRAWVDEQRLLGKDADPIALESDLLFCRAKAGAFIGECLDAGPWDEYGIVGFSSQFHQQIASLALARRLKIRHPGFDVVFGGANCRAGMGRVLLERFPFIDAVCTGEGDAVFPEYAARLRDGLPGVSAPGLLCRGSADAGEAAPPTDLNALPDPDFDDFFRQRERRPEPGLERLFVLFETSRGCWWGEKSHCAFCGLNGEALAFRGKSGDRVFGEIVRQKERYGRSTRFFAAVDNNLPPEIIRTFLPRVRDAGLDVDLFFDARPGLTIDQLDLFRGAGLREIQAGLESLDTASLRRMRKGLTALGNIQTLKWCRQMGIAARWYYLFGLPGEDADALVRPLLLMPLLSHLQPPYEARTIRIDRFSPYWSDPAAHGLRDLRPADFYRRVYPELSEDDLARLAYYFDADWDTRDGLRERAAPLLRGIEEWTEQAPRSALFSLDEGEALLVCDFRPAARKPLHSLTGLFRRAYEACDRIRSRAEIRSLLTREPGREATDGECEAVLAPLLEGGLMIEEDGRYLSLAIPLGFEYFPPEPLWSRLAEIPGIASSFPA